jgi:hypothetical protein
MKWLVLIVVGVVFLIPLVAALRFGSLWEIYRGYVDTVSNVTGLNGYLVTAVSALLFIPFSMGVSMSLSWNRARRRQGEAILLGLFVAYNLGLFVGTRNAYFSFSKGETLKWYALTPDGVQLYDRAGADPKYGIELKPVTKDIVRQLELMKKGEFKPIDPDKAALFNPITGEPQAWYWHDAEGSWEFYDKPGFHPRTGTALQPVTKEIYSEWKRAIAERAPRQAEATGSNTGRQSDVSHPSAEPQPIRPIAPLPPADVLPSDSASTDKSSNKLRNPWQ